MNTSQIIILTLLFISLSTYIFAKLYLKTFLIQSESNHKYIVVKKIFRLTTLVLAILFFADIFHLFW
jgi:hypothetical protein